MEITDAWFDGPVPVPNPLHPVGAVIDPVARTVQVRRPDPEHPDRVFGLLLTLRAGDAVYDDGTVEIGPNSTMASVSGHDPRVEGLDTRPERAPALRDLWRD